MAVIVEERVYGLDLLRVRDGPDLAAFRVQDLPVVVLFHTVLVPAAPSLRGFVQGGLPVLDPILGGLFNGVRHGVCPVPLKCLVAGRGYHGAGHTACQQGQRERERAKYRQSFHHDAPLIQSISQTDPGGWPSAAGTIAMVKGK